MRAVVLKSREIGASALPLAVVLTRWSCRNNYRPRRFLAWLGPWLAVSVFAAWSCDTARVFLSLPDGISSLSLRIVLPQLAVMSLCLAGILYLVNLPFMWLAVHCPVYRDRFHKLLRLPACKEPATLPE